MEIRITNTQPRVLHLPDALTFDEDKGGPRFNGLGSGKSLPPGGHNISVAVWEKAKSNRAVASWIELGWLKEGGDTDAPEGVPAPVSLAGYNAAAAITFVETEDSPTVLALWLKAEQRAEVSASISRRIAALAPAPITEKRGPGRPKKAT